MELIVALTAIALMALPIGPINQYGGDGDSSVEVTIYVTNSNYYLFAFNSGHVFVSINNPNGFSINVGYYTLPAYSNVYVGKWPSSFAGNAIAPFSGLNYNYESYLANEGESSNDGYSLVARRVTCTTSDLAVASTYASSVNSGYTLISDDCATFATTFFNKAAGSNSLQVTGVPSEVTNQILPDEAHRILIQPEDLARTSQSFYFSGTPVAQNFYPQ